MLEGPGQNDGVFVQARAPKRTCRKEAGSKAPLQFCRAVELQTNVNGNPSQNIAKGPKLSCSKKKSEWHPSQNNGGFPTKKNMSCFLLVSILSFPLSPGPEASRFQL